MIQVVLVGSAAVVGGLIGLATNVASAQRTPWPGPLRWIQDNPWGAMATLVWVINEGRGFWSPKFEVFELPAPARLDPSAHPLSETIHEGLVLAHAPAWALDVDHDGPMQQPIEDGRGHDRVAEQLGPAWQAAVGGDDGG